MNISSPPLQAPQLRPPQANAASAWHRDFLTQQASVAQPSGLRQSPYGGGSSYSPGLIQPSFQLAPVPQVARGKQPAQETTNPSNDAAFEAAFLQAESQIARRAEAETEQKPLQANPDLMSEDRLGEMDPLLVRMRETRPGV